MEELDQEGEFFARYLEATGLKETDYQAALKLAYDHRKFEIDLYWKRATYFWAFQAVAFASVGLFLKDGALPPNANIMLVPVLLGAITAAVGWMTSSGSKFWQENWESHVDLLENQLKARVTATILTRDEPRYSVSKLNQGLLGCLFVGWIGAFTYFLFRTHIDRIAAQLHWIAPVLAMAFLLGSVGVLWWTGRSQLSGFRHALGEPGWNEFGMSKKRQPAILWRDSVGLRARPPT